MIASTVTDDMDAIAAAALHDVVEDTDRTVDDIRRDFGDRIARIVCHESEDKHPGMDASESWKMRKRMFLDSLTDAPYEVKVVALADKLSNMHSMASDHRVLGMPCGRVQPEGCVQAGVVLLQHSENPRGGPGEHRCREGVFEVVWGGVRKTIMKFGGRFPLLFAYFTIT